jgi:Tfp pilus assembly protein FimT
MEVCMKRHPRMSGLTLATAPVVVALIALPATFALPHVTAAIARVRTADGAGLA